MSSSTSGPSDRITTIVEAAFDDVSLVAAVRNMAATMKAEFQRQLPLAEAEQLIPTLKSRETATTTAGKRVEITGQVRGRRKMIEVEGVEVEGEEIEAEFSAQIKEITEAQALADRIARENFKKRLARNRRIARAEERIQKERQKEFERTFVDENELSASGEKLSHEIKVENKQRIAEGKRRMREGEQIHKIIQARAASAHIDEDVLRASGEKLQKQIRGEKRTEFGDWRKRVTAMDDPIAQLAEIDKFISVATGRYIAEGKVFRKQVERRIARDASQATQGQAANFRNLMLTLSSGGLGLFGAAGFPLLNIGFAATSGGVVGAGVAAATTAVGEFIRAMNALRQESIQTAKQIGFVSKGFKEAEAVLQAAQGVSAFGPMTVQRIGAEQRTRIFEESIRRGDKGQETLQTAAEAFKLIKDQVLITGSIVGVIPDFFDRFKQIQVANTPQQRLQDLESARQNMFREMFRGGKIETDPYQVWLGIQTAALDPARQEDLNIQRRQLQEMEKSVVLAREALRLEQERTAREATRPSSAFFSGPSW